MTFAALTRGSLPSGPFHKGRQGSCTLGPCGPVSGWLVVSVLLVFGLLVVVELLVVVLGLPVVLPPCGGLELLVAAVAP